MKENLRKIVYGFSLSLAFFLLINPVGLAAVCRGIPYDTGTTPKEGFFWNATTFDGFCYPVNKHENFINYSWGEKLAYIEKNGSDHGPLGKKEPQNKIIDKEELVYSTVSYPSKQQIASKLGIENLPADVKDPSYHTLAWFGKPYIAVENDATKLAPLVCKQGGKAQKYLKSGETWELGKGYNLNVQQVDVEGNKVWFTLEKEGKELESAIIDAAGPVTNRIFTGTAEIGEKEEQLYFITYVDSIFQGPLDSLVVFKYTWLIDKAKVLEIEEGDEFYDFEVKETSAKKLVLKNKNSITLKPDTKTYFTDNWYFQTSDEKKGLYKKGYIIYPAVDISVESQTKNTMNDALAVESKAETKAPINIKPEPKNVAEKERTLKNTSKEKEKTGSKPGLKRAEREEEPENEKTPGFGLLAGSLGLLAGAKRRK